VDEDRQVGGLILREFGGTQEGRLRAELTGNGRDLFIGMPFDPPRAGMIANISVIIVSRRGGVSPPRAREPRPYK
jgi:hypothetical protein